jgi:putative 2OG-Fe(II) oxygenase
MSPAFDDALENFFQNAEVKEKLSKILGDGYKIWEVSIRLSTGHDEGLYFHQDAPGEVGLSIFLTDQDDGGGTTTVVPRSHRLNVSPEEISFGRIVKLFKGPLRRLLVPITGRTGDSFIFLKKTWHGRVSNSGGKEGLAIMIGLFPVGYKFRPFPCPEEILNKLGPNLRLRMDPNRGFENAADNLGRKFVTGSAASRSILIDNFYAKPTFPGYLGRLVLIAPLRFAKVVRKITRALFSTQIQQ